MGGVGEEHSSVNSRRGGGALMVEEGIMALILGALRCGVLLCFFLCSAFLCGQAHMPFIACDQEEAKNVLESWLLTVVNNERISPAGCSHEV